MKKSGIVFVLVSLLLAAAAMPARKLELMRVLDSTGLAVFRPITAVLIALSILAAIFYILFARHEVEQTAEPRDSTAYHSTGLPGVAWGAVSLVVQLLGAWLLFRSWKSGGKALDLVLGILAGLAGAAWLYLRIREWKGTGSRGSGLLAGSLVTLFTCLWLIAYYRDEAAEPSLVLTVYGFLALCACCIAVYSYSGGSVERLKPRRTLAVCGLAMYLSLVALVRQEAPAYRLFWLVSAMQLGQCGLVLLSPKAPEPEAAVSEGEPEEVPVSGPEAKGPVEGPDDAAEPPAPEGEEG